jgi:hypothetical protein
MVFDVQKVFWACFWEHHFFAQKTRFLRLSGCHFAHKTLQFHAKSSLKIMKYVKILGFRSIKRVFRMLWDNFFFHDFFGPSAEIFDPPTMPL